MSTVLEVAVGIILDSRRRILVEQRSARIHLGEFWGFPGGKRNADESLYAALCREIKEEVGVDLIEAEFLMRFYHDYKEYSVALNVWFVHRYNGVPEGKEGQTIQWVSLEHLNQLPLLPGNKKILAALQRRYPNTPKDLLSKPRLP